MNLLLILGLAASGWAAGYFTGKPGKDKVIVSKKAITDAISNGVLKESKSTVIIRRDWDCY